MNSIRCLRLGERGHAFIYAHSMQPLHDAITRVGDEAASLAAQPELGCRDAH